MPYYLILPFLAAAGYSLSSLFFKQAYQNGARTSQSFHWANLISMVLLGGIVFFGTGMAWHDVWRPAVVAALIYLGSLVTFAAIQAGDVSLVTPLLGAKVICVALLTPLITGTALHGLVLAASVLTTVGIFVLGKKDFSRSKGSRLAIAYCLLSCILFASADILMQDWAPLCGGYTFLGALSLLVGFYSLVHVLCTDAGLSQLRVPPAAIRSLLWGCLILTLQGIIMGISLSFFHDAARVNVVYSSRGLWSLFLVWQGGKWFGNAESTDSREALGWRLAGSLLVTAAIVLALFPQI